MVRVEKAGVGRAVSPEVPENGGSCDGWEPLKVDNQNHWREKFRDLRNSVNQQIVEWIRV